MKFQWREQPWMVEECWGSLLIAIARALQRAAAPALSVCSPLPSLRLPTSMAAVVIARAFLIDVNIELGLRLLVGIGFVYIRASVLRAAGSRRGFVRYLSCAGLVFGGICRTGRARSSWLKAGGFASGSEQNYTQRCVTLEASAQAASD
jgi:hypothetical protein